MQHLDIFRVGTLTSQHRSIEIPVPVPDRNTYAVLSIAVVVYVWDSVSLATVKGYLGMFSDSPCVQAAGSTWKTKI